MKGTRKLVKGFLSHLELNLLQGTEVEDTNEQ